MCTQAERYRKTDRQTDKRIIKDISRVVTLALRKYDITIQGGPEINTRTIEIYCFKNIILDHGVCIFTFKNY